MSIDRLNDPRAFRVFLDARLTGDGPDLTLDDYLDLWHHENEPADDLDASAEAVREALDDLKAGDLGRPAAEVLATLRREGLGIPPPPPLR